MRRRKEKEGKEIVRIGLKYPDGRRSCQMSKTPSFSKSSYLIFAFSLQIKKEGTTFLLFSYWSFDLLQSPHLRLHALQPQTQRACPRSVRSSLFQWRESSSPLAAPWICSRLSCWEPSSHSSPRRPFPACFLLPFLCCLSYWCPRRKNDRASIPRPWWPGSLPWGCLWWVRSLIQPRSHIHRLPLRIPWRVW